MQARNNTKTFLNNLNDAVVHLLTLKDTKWTHYMIKLKINCNPPVIYFPKNASPHQQVIFIMCQKINK